MKILFVNTTAHTGGASIACERLMNALKTHGHEVRLLMRDDKHLINRVRFIWERLRLLPHVPYTRIFNVDDGRCGIDITKTKDFAWADAIHLHWINQAMISLEDLERLVKLCRENNKPLVWTMHDIWPATGICHLPGDCNHWHNGCGDCPILRKGHSNDISARTFQHKAKIFNHGDIRFVTCSNFLAQTAKKSPLLQKAEITTIHNPLDTEYFCPGPQERKALGLPAEKHLILFVAYNTNDPNKGLSDIVSAIHILTTYDPTWRDRLALVPVGKNAAHWQGKVDCEVYPFEYVHSRETMRALYRSCDVLTVASKMENLPNTIAEAKSCGLPVVGTNVGGIPEMLRHTIDGFLSKPNAESIAEGLKFVLTHPTPAQLSSAAREDAIKQFSEHNVVKSYEHLYQ